jgi:hypothetical protein
LISELNLNSQIPVKLQFALILRQDLPAHETSLHFLKFVS